MNSHAQNPRLALIRVLGFVMGSAFLLGGILAFVPGVTKDGMYFGLFMVNTPHNIMHIVSGTMFYLASAAGPKPARLWFLLFGAFYGALALMGLFVGDGLIFGLIMNSPFDSWGHMGLAVIMLSVALFVGKEKSWCQRRPA